MLTAVLLSALAQTSAVTVCGVIDPILQTAGLDKCACEPSASGVGGTTTCEIETPEFSFSPPALAGGGTLTIPKITAEFGAEILPCGDPAKASIHGQVTLPDNGLAATALEAVEDELGDAGFTVDGSTLKMEKSVEAGKALEIMVARARGRRSGASPPPPSRHPTTARISASLHAA